MDSTNLQLLMALVLALTPALTTLFISVLPARWQIRIKKNEYKFYYRVLLGIVGIFAIFSILNII